jgi:FkbM family methyltransferase
MRRSQQFIRFLTDAEILGWGFARAALRPWKHKEPFAIMVPSIGPVFVRGDNSDVATVRTVFRDKDYAIPADAVRTRLLARMESIISAGGVPLIVDAGANIGAASLWFHAEYPKAHVLAVEPDPANAVMWRRNCDAREGLSLVEAAIGSEAGRVVLEDHGASDAVRTVRGDEGVVLVTMDELMSGVPDAVPFIAKIDIEGFESDLFAANTSWIDKFDAIMIELHDWMLPGQGSSATVQREMGRRAGFEIFLSGENLIYVREQGRESDIRE